MSGIDEKAVDVIARVVEDHEPRYITCVTAGEPHSEWFGCEGCDFTTDPESDDHQRDHVAHVAERVWVALKDVRDDIAAEALRWAVLDKRMTPGDPALRVLLDRAREIERADDGSTS